jgi:hypothetical protein
MGFFDDDDFFGGGIDEFLKRFAGDGNFEYTSVGPNGKKTVRKGRRNVLGKLLLNKVETSKRIYYLFDLTGKKNITARIKRISSEKILEVNENGELLFEYTLEDSEIEDFDYKFNNGILEVSYRA